MIGAGGPVCVLGWLSRRRRRLTLVPRLRAPLARLSFVSRSQSSRSLPRLLESRSRCRCEARHPSSISMFTTESTRANGDSGFVRWSRRTGTARRAPAGRERVNEVAAFAWRVSVTLALSVEPSSRAKPSDDGVRACACC